MWSRNWRLFPRGSVTGRWRPSTSSGCTKISRVRRLAVCGASGSIGRQTLDICRRHRDRLQVVLLSVHRQTGPLPEWIAEFKPQAVCITDPAAGDVPTLAGTRVFRGRLALAEAFAATDFDLLVNGIVGAAGLEPSCRALEQGRTVATANKESLVIAGALLTRLAGDTGAEIRPIDSEHSAIWQCMQAGRPEEVDRVWITASGGPFRARPLSTFSSITVDEALGHPTWRMGDKITVDSATMMNKGFEVIEARWLFGLEPRQIEVVVHPESIVHSAVTFRDGSTVAQLGQPDMRHPIQYALLYPERLGPPPTSLDLKSLGALHFEPPDETRFPALRLAREAMLAGGAYPVALNAANEVAVEAFLTGRNAYVHITECVETQLGALGGEEVNTLDDIYEIDRSVREQARRWLATRSPGPAASASNSVTG